MRAVRPASDDNIVPLRRFRTDRSVNQVVIVVTLDSIDDGGRLSVRDARGAAFLADWLQGQADPVELRPGDRLLALFPSGETNPVVVGRVGPYVRSTPSKRVQIESSETLSLRCGQSSLDLRADGKVMIRGEDVLVRARGTKRIKAGTVNIN